MNEISPVRAIELPWRLEQMPGGEMARIVGRDSRDLIVAFSSWHHDQSQFGADAAYDFINTVIFSRSDGLLIRDRSNNWYQHGVPGADDGPHAIAMVIKKVAIGYDRIITLGSSMGGYAALLFAHLIKADRAVAVVPQMRIGTIEATGIGDHRFSEDYARIDANSHDRGFLALDRLSLSERTKYYAVYGDKDPYDVFHVPLAQRAQIDVKIMQDQDHNGTATAVLKQRMLELVL